MAAVMHKLDAMPTDGVDAQTIDALRSQLNSIAWRLEQPEDNTEVNGRLDALVERMDAPKEPSDLADDTIGRIATTLSESLEDRLIERFDGQLSTRLADLTEVLHRTTAPLAELGPRMDALEESMGDAQITLVDTARSAAEEVVRSMLEQQALMAPAEVEAVAALDEDLKRLESLTVDNDARNNKTFDAVHETLLKIVDRLDQLDTMVAGQGQAPDAAALAAALAQAQPAPAPVQTVNEPARQSIAAPAGIDAFAGLHPDMPLQPGTHEPRFDPAGIDAGTGERTMDVDTIVDRVRSGDADKSDPAADFMAAARRKAKVVAAESEFTKAGGDDAKPARKGKKPKVVKAANDDGTSVRRPLLIAAAAAIVAAIGLVGFNFVSSNGSDEVALLPDTAVIEDVNIEDAPPISELGEEIGFEGTAIEDEASIEIAEADPIEATTDLEIEVPTDPIETQAIETTNTFEEVQEQIGEVSVGLDEPDASIDDVSLPQTTVTGPITDIELTDADGPAPLVAAAKSGDARALFEIAGRTATTDPVRAFTLYSASAQRGLAPAQYRVGQAYEKGRGTGVDLELAREWYGRAAEAGNTSAMHNLAVLYAMGADGQADPETAGRWFTEAAEHGVKDSQYNLGILYAQGNGVAEDLTESYKWFDAAAKAGDPEAGTKREEVKAALSEAQLAEAQAKVAAWQARTPALAANRVVVPDDWRIAPNVSEVDMTKAVRNVQAILNKAGFDAGVPDGVMGKKTRQAIMQFQTSVGQKATGEIDEALVKELLARNT